MPINLIFRSITLRDTLSINTGEKNERDTESRNIDAARTEAG